MGFRFRKTFNFNGFRINLSKSGIGYSYGVRGLRKTRKAGGGSRITASIHETGISYVYDSHKRKVIKQSNCPTSTENNQYSNISNCLEESSKNDFIDKLNFNIKFMLALRICIISLLISIGIIISSVFHNPLGGVIIIVGIVSFFAIPKNKAINIDYVFENKEFENVFNKMNDAINELTHISRLFSFDTFRTYRQLTSIKTDKINIKYTKTVKCNCKIKSLLIKDCELLFLPNIIAAKQKNKWIGIDWKDFSINIAKTNFLDDSPADDSEIISQTYKYITKSGKPDKRYKNNPVKYECEYAGIELSSNNGLHLLMMASNYQIANSFYEIILNAKSTYSCLD